MDMDDEVSDYDDLAAEIPETNWRGKSFEWVDIATLSKEEAEIYNSKANRKRLGLVR